MNYNRPARHAYQVQPVGNLVPDANTPTNSTLGVVTILMVIAILVLAALSLSYIIRRTNHINDCLDMMKTTLSTINTNVQSLVTDMVTVLSNLVNITNIVTAIQTVVNMIQSIVMNTEVVASNTYTLVNTTVVECLEYIKTKLDANMLMVDSDCDDNNVCTIDLCDSQGGCVHRPIKSNPPTTCHDYCRRDPIVKKRDNTSATSRSVIPNGSCANGRCVSTEPCKGNCPTSVSECPALVFDDPSACTLDCTRAKMCVWHCSFYADTPWVDVAGLEKTWLEADSRIDLMCRAFLDTTDFLTGKVAENDCLMVNHQLFKDTPSKRNVEQEHNQTGTHASRNAIEQWKYICQYHFACSAAIPDAIPVI